MQRLTAAIHFAAIAISFMLAVLPVVLSKCYAAVDSLFIGLYVGASVAEATARSRPR
jgi:hypothetical protein